MSLNNYDANSIKTLSPREAVRENYAMYIGDNTSRGMHHLATEIIANAMDEAAAGFGNVIRIYVWSKENKLAVEDKGRGIPFGKNSEGKWAIVEMCTSLHSGGKFNNSNNYKSSLGLHGLGATVTNALSSYFSINVKRAEGSCKLEFINGNQSTFDIDSSMSFKDTGSIVSFIPDSLIFGDNKWNKETLMNELQLHALLNNNLKFELIWDEEVIATYCYQNGIKDMLQIKFGDLKPICSPIYSKTILNSGKSDECTVEIALQYTNDGSERVYAFTNGGYNPDLGTHVTGFRSAWTSLVNNKARELGLIDIAADNLDGSLIRKGLVLILSIKMNERPMFAEQTKLKLTSPSARTFVSQAVSKMIVSKSDMEAIVKKALIEKKVEDAAQRKREAERKVASGGKNMSMLKELPANFADSIDRDGCELFIVEGKSAAGSAKMGRNVHTQAIFQLRGKPLNTYGKELADIIKNQEIQNLLKVLGCGVGDKFNIKNLRYDKIIYLADADADGGHINCLLSTLFLYHLPHLIEAGKVYCALPPLFRLTKGKDRIFTSDNDMVKKYSSKGYEVQRIKGLGEQSAEELWDSTMNPETRQLVQLTPDNMEDMISLYDILMGNSSKNRRSFIVEHARQYQMVREDSEDEGDSE